MTSATNCTFDELDQLAQLGYEVDWLWYDIIALALFSTLFLTIAYSALCSSRSKLPYYRLCYVCFLLTTRMYCQLHLHCILMFIYGDQLLTLYNHNLMIYWHPCELFPEHQYFKISNACVHRKSRLLPLYLYSLVPSGGFRGDKGGAFAPPLASSNVFLCK